MSAVVTESVGYAVIMEATLIMYSCCILKLLKFSFQIFTRQGVVGTKKHGTSFQIIAVTYQ
jgi:hypothetical protein